MTSNEYLSLLKQRYKNSYDITEPESLKTDIDIDMLASYRMRGERYILTRKIKLYAVEENELCFVKSYKNKIEKEDAEALVSQIKKSITELVNPNPDHMRTFLTGVIIGTNGYTESAFKYIKNFRYSHSFRFNLNGWCEIRLVLIDLQNSEVIHHRREKELQRFYCFRHVLPEAE